MLNNILISAVIVLICLWFLKDLKETDYLSFIVIGANVVLNTLNIMFIVLYLL
jgi:hypothetical protein